MALVFITLLNLRLVHTAATRTRHAVSILTRGVSMSAGRSTRPGSGPFRPSGPVHQLVTGRIRCFEAEAFVEPAEATAINQRDAEEPAVSKVEEPLHDFGCDPLLPIIRVGDEVEYLSRIGVTDDATEAYEGVRVRGGHVAEGECQCAAGLVPRSFAVVIPACGCI